MAKISLQNTSLLVLALFLKLLGYDLLALNMFFESREKGYIASSEKDFPVHGLTQFDKHWPEVIEFLRCPLNSDIDFTPLILDLVTYILN